LADKKPAAKPLRTNDSRMRPHRPRAQPLDLTIILGLKVAA